MFFRSFVENFKSMLQNRLVALLCALCFIPSFAFSQIDNPKRTFRDLRALDGVWFMPTDRGDRLELWSVENDSTILGKAVRIKAEDGDTITLETMRLTRRDTHIVYSVIVRGQNQNQPIDFDLTEAYVDEFLFENPAHDDPKKIRYVLLGNREMQVYTEGKKGNRTVTREYVFEREFNPASTEIRCRVGTNGYALGAERDFSGMDNPEFGVLPGWELGMGPTFRGRGGFLALNTEIGLAGKYSQVKSEFEYYKDTLYQYVRDGNYRSIWFTAAVYPEFTFRRDGKLSMVVGPYYARLLTSRVKGTATPNDNGKLFESSNDLKKNDFGLVGGLQYKLQIGKKDLDGKIGARFNLGLTDLDNLYKRRCTNPALCNERVLLRGVSLYYSVNLVKL